MKKRIFAALAIGIGVTTAHAEAQSEPVQDRKVLLRGPLPGADGENITIQRITYPPGWSGRRHVHSGSVYVYVVDGSFTVGMEGGRPASASTGELINEPGGRPMRASNASASEPVTVLLIQVNAKDLPLTTKVE